MKIQNAILVLSLVISFSAEAGHYRAWQGFTKTGLSCAKFLADLSPFMRDTVDIYTQQADNIFHKGIILDNYIVVIPPANKPAFVPDELALLDITSRADYQALRQTPEGQKYADRHWDIFEKGVSKSADPMVDFSVEQPAALIHNQSYDVIGAPIRWSEGQTFVFIGLRKANVSSQEFLRHLASHLAATKRAFQPKGLLGYVVIANNDYEVAYMNWAASADVAAAAQTPGGEFVIQDAASIMNNLMFEAAKPFVAGLPVQMGAAYSTMPSSYQPPFVDDGEGH